MKFLFLRNKLIFALGFCYSAADSTLIFTTELVALQKRSMFKLGSLLFILPWPVLAGMLLYYLYKKATVPVAKKHKEGQIRNKKGKKKN